MKVRIYLILILSCLYADKILAQQDAIFTFYREDLNLINPAYAGAGEKAILGADIRSQWSGVQGAPESQGLFFSIPSGRKVGLGLVVINDRTFVENQTAVGGDFSYRISLDENTQLLLGIRASAQSYRVNSDGLSTYDIVPDPSLGGLDRSFKPNVGIGALLRTKWFYVSLSSPKLIRSNRVTVSDGTAKLGRNNLHIHLASGTSLKIGPDLQLQPFVMIRYVENAPWSTTLSLGLDYNERFGFGAGYRVNEGLGGYISFVPLTGLKIGYAYEAAVASDLYRNSKGSHEVYMRISF